MAAASCAPAGTQLPADGFGLGPTAAPPRWDGVDVAVVGLGTENMPLVRYLVGQGARVVACDRKGADEFGPQADELRRLGVRLVLGPDYLRGLEGVRVAFVSPGIPKNLPALQAARRAGVRLSGQVDLFLRLCPAPVIGITGSAGKTTTTTLIGRMLKATGRPVFVGGNIGEPLIERLGEIGPQAWVVLELSSFQLETTGVSPHGAVVTNITPNHLDVHESMEAYVAAKQRIVAFQGAGDFAVLNADDAVVSAMRDQTPGAVVWFGMQRPRTPGAWLEGDRLMVCLQEGGPAGGGVELMRRSEIRLRGSHNVANVLAAAAAVLYAGCPVEGVREAVRSFTGVPHRLEEVARVDGVLYVNDSIATTPARAMAALASFAEPVVLIAGGYDKHLPFDELARVVVRRCRHVVLMGQTAGAIERALEAAEQELGQAAGQQPGGPGAVRPTRSRAASLEQALEQARQAARPGDVVLLSPACASYDMFRNFEQRGARFRELVRAMAAGEEAGR